MALWCIWLQSASLNDKGMQALASYKKVNVKGTQRLAKAAIQSEEKRFYLY